MAKSRRRSGKRQGQMANGNPLWPILLALGFGLLLLGGMAGLGRASFLPAADFTPQAEGPRLAVDRESIDLGLQPLDRRVSAVFRVKNVGGKTLHVQGEPYVELVEGC
jgi:hypothetical protein